VSDPRSPADAVVVLAGGEGERLRAAIERWRAGDVGAMLIVGTSSPVLEVYAGEDSLTMAEAKRRIAIKKGVPPEKVLVALGPTSTYEEAVRTFELCRERGWRRLIVVTSPFHTRRARATFRSVFRGSGVTVAIFHPDLDGSQDDPRRWWSREGDAVSVAGECARIAYYAYRHRIWR
jgi:uncharacterized SAM-binding protein YcdF (DUF218 family)